MEITRNNRIEVKLSTAQIVSRKCATGTNKMPVFTNNAVIIFGLISLSAFISSCSGGNQSSASTMSSSSPPGMENALALSESDWESQPDLMPVQRVNNFSVKYPYPFLMNEAATSQIRSAVNLNTQDLPSMSIYNSRSSCGIEEAGLAIGIYGKNIPINEDGAANGMVNNISTLSGIVSPESEITPTTVSGYSSRRISYRAKRYGAVIGVEAISIVDHKTNTTWVLQLLFGTPSSEDYSTLNSAKACANKILDSVAINNDPY